MTAIEIKIAYLEDQISAMYKAAAMNENQGQLKSASACRKSARELERELEEIKLDKILIG